MSEQRIHIQTPSVGASTTPSSSTPGHFKEKSTYSSRNIHTNPSPSIRGVCVDLLAHVFTYRQKLGEEETSSQNPLLSRFSQQSPPGEEAEAKLLQLRNDLLRLQNWSLHKEKKIQAALAKQPLEKSAEEVSSETSLQPLPSDIPSLSTQQDFPDLVNLERKIVSQFSEIFRQPIKSLEDSSEFDYTLSFQKKGDKLTNLLQELKELNTWLNVLQREVEKTLPKREVTATVSPRLPKEEIEPSTAETRSPSTKLSLWKKFLLFLTSPV